MTLASPLATIASRLSASMDKGVLPWPGGLMAQPARAMAAARLWSTAVAASLDREHLRGESFRRMRQ